MHSKVITLRIPQDVAQAIEARAEVVGRSKSQVILDRLTHPYEPPLPLISQLIKAEPQSLQSSLTKLQAQLSQHRVLRQNLAKHRLELKRQRVHLHTQKIQLQGTIHQTKCLIAARTAILLDQQNRP